MAPRRSPKTSLQAAKDLWLGHKSQRRRELEDMDKSNLHDIVAEYGIFTRSKTRKEALIKALLDTEMPDPQDDQEYLAYARGYVVRETEAHARKQIDANIHNMVSALKTLMREAPKVIEDLEQHGANASSLSTYWGGNRYLKDACKRYLTADETFNTFDQFNDLFAHLGVEETPEREGDR